MTESTTIGVWLFPDDIAAQRTTYRSTSWTLAGLRIDDAGVVSWPLDRVRPLAWQAREVAAAPLSGAFWGLVFGSLFLLPLAEQSPAGPCLRGSKADGAGDESLRALGLGDQFVTSVRTSVVPGTSAIFLLFPSELTDQVSSVLTRSALPVSHLTLSPSQRTRLHAGFDD